MMMMINSLVDDDVKSPAEGRSYKLFSALLPEAWIVFHRISYLKTIVFPLSFINQLCFRLVLVLVNVQGERGYSALLVRNNPKSRSRSAGESDKWYHHGLQDITKTNLSGSE